MLSLGVAHRFSVNVMVLCSGRQIMQLGKAVSASSAISSQNPSQHRLNMKPTRKWAVAFGIPETVQVLLGGGKTSKTH